MEFRMLGGMSAFQDGRPVALGRRQERCLLGLLLLEPGRVVSTARLLDLLWNGTPPASGRATVHSYVARLRSNLAPSGVTIAARDGGYAVDADPQSVDVHRFVAEVGRSGELDDPAERVRVLTGALVLWNGPILAGVAEPVVSERLSAQLTETCLSAREALADAQLATGRPDLVVASLPELVDQHPTRERLAGLLMLALYRSGQQDKALETYRRVRDTLAADLGLDPTAELQDLHRKILANDRGLHPGAAAVVHKRRFLPRDLPDFTGREADLLLLDRLADDHSDKPATVIVTAIAGVGGAGKTALAVRWGHKEAERFPDGQLYIDLRGFDRREPVSPADAVVRLLISLGVPQERIPTAFEAGRDLFRSLLADKRLLIVLDNAASVDQVRPLLAGGPGCVVLITSRDLLGGLIARDGARRIMLDVLSSSDAVALLAAILGADRVSAEPRAAAELADLCGCLPLALRIAAANIAARPELSLSDHAGELTAANRLAALAVDGDPDAAVRAVFAHSYNALPAASQRLFALLGLPSGADIGLPAIKALAGSDVDAALADLVVASLVTESAPGRYTMHDLIRLYAYEQRGAEGDGALADLFAYYLATASAAIEAASPQTTRLPLPAAVAPSAVSFEDTVSALDWLQREEANLVAATQQAAAQGPHWIAWHLADTLRGYFWIRRGVADWMATARAGLAAAEAEQDSAGQAAMNLSLGIAHRAVANLSQSIDHLTSALEHARAAGWAECEATVIGSLGLAHAEAGDARTALGLLEQAAQVNRRLGRTANVAVNLGNIGGLRHDFGELRQAEQDLAQALALYRETGNAGGEAIMLTNLGMTCWELGDVGQARQYLRSSLSLHRELGDGYGEAIALATSSRDHLHAGDLTAARDCAEEALRITQTIGDIQHEAASRTVKAEVDLHSGDLAAAVAGFEAALAQGRQIAHPVIQANALDGLARAHAADDRLADARTRAENALAISRQGTLIVAEAQACITLAEILSRQGRPAEAAEYARLAAELTDRSGYAHCGERIAAVLSPVSG